jgi:hypothetical protein
MGYHLGGVCGPVIFPISLSLFRLGLGFMGFASLTHTFSLISRRKKEKRNRDQLLPPIPTGGVLLVVPPLREAILQRALVVLRHVDHLPQAVLAGGDGPDGVVDLLARRAEGLVVLVLLLHVEADDAGVGGDGEVVVAVAVVVVPPVCAAAAASSEEFPLRFLGEVHPVDYGADRG